MHNYIPSDERDPINLIVFGRISDENYSAIERILDDQITNVYIGLHGIILIFPRLKNANLKLLEKYSLSRNLIYNVMHPYALEEKIPTMSIVESIFLANPIDLDTNLDLGIFCNVLKQKQVRNTTYVVN